MKKYFYVIVIVLLVIGIALIYYNTQNTHKIEIKMTCPEPQEIETVSLNHTPKEKLQYAKSPEVVLNG